MATKDFRASQIETSKIIGTGSITGTAAGIAIYSGSIASNRAGGTSDSAMFNKVGSDVFLFVSGTISPGNVSGVFNRENVSLFGGDVVVSGTLYAERQVVEVDSTVPGNFFVTGNMLVEPDSNSTKSVAFRNAAGTDIFIVDSTNQRVGVGVTDPDSKVEIFGTGTQLKLSNNADDSASFAVGTNGDLTVTTVDAAGGAANFTVVADGAVDIDANAGALSLDGSTGINIGTETDVAIDINASTLTIDASSTLSIDAQDDLNLTVTSSGAGEDLTISQIGGNDSSIIITAAGTGTDAIDVHASGGDMQVRTSASGKSVSITAAGGGTQEVDISSAGTSSSAIDINATAGGIDIDAVGAITIDGTAAIGITSTGTDTTIKSTGARVVLSGSSGSDSVLVQSDMEILGSLHGGSPLKINDDIALTGSARLKEQSAPVAGPNEAVLYAKDDSGITKLFMKQSDGTEVGPLGSGGSLNDAYDTPSGGGTKAAGVGAIITVDGQPIQIVRNTPGDLVLAVTGSAIFGETSSQFGNQLPPLPGDDATFFVSGALGSRGSNTGGVSVFGGDFVVSGSSHFEAANFTGDVTLEGNANLIVPVAIQHKGDVNTSINFNNDRIRLFTNNTAKSDFTSTQVLILSGGSASSPDPAGGSDVNFVVSGAIGSRGSATKGTSVFGGDAFVSGSLGINTVNITSDGKVGIGVSSPAYKLSVGGNAEFGEYLYHRGNADTNLRFETDKITLTAGTMNGLSVIENGTSSEVVVNDGNVENLDFRVETNNNTHQIHSDSGFDLLVLGSNQALPPGAGSDTNVFTSGSIGTKGVDGGATAVFGGDLVTSGNFYAGSNLSFDGSTLMLTGALEVGSGDVSIIANSRLRFNNPGQNDQFIHGNDTTLTIDGDDSVAISADSSATVTVGSNLVQFTGTNSRFNVSRANADFTVNTDDYYGTFLIDGNDNTIVLGNESFDSTPAAAEVSGYGDDVKLYLSGTAGSKDTSTRGVTLIAGDAVISGSLSALGGQSSTLHVYNHGKLNFQNGDRFFSPFNPGDAVPSSNIDNIALHTIVPYSGSLERVTLATRGGTQTSVTVGLYVNGVLAGEMTGSGESGAVTYGGLTGIRRATFDFTGKSPIAVSGSVTFNPNDMVSMQINTRASRETSVTTVFRLNDSVDPDEILGP